MLDKKKEIAALKGRAAQLQFKLDRKINELADKFNPEKSTELAILKEQVKTLEESLEFIKLYPFMAYTVNALVVDSSKHEKDIDLCVQAQKLIGLMIDAESGEIHKEINPKDLN